MTKRPAPKDAPVPVLRRRGVRIALGIVVAVVAVAGIAYLVLDEPRPRGHRGGEAETMARAIQASVNIDAWEVTSAVKFVFRHRNEHLWDRQRHFDRVRHGNTEVLLRVDTHTGIARENGDRVRGDRERELVDAAYFAWTNDTFWLNPIAKFLDAGATRGVVTGDDGVRRLLVSYGDVGLTPGDAYLWTPGDGGPPAEWRMWTHALRLGGLRGTWERWITLRTGAKISTLHHVGPFTVELSHVQGRGTLHELCGSEDPFADLVAEDRRAAEREAARADGGI